MELENKVTRSRWTRILHIVQRASRVVDHARGVYQATHRFDAP